MRLRRLARCLGMISALSAAAALAVTCVGPPSYYAAKYRPAGPAHRRPLPGPIRPEPQTEPHTCGLCSLTALYRAYGLDPELLRVRFRTGVDKPAVNFLPDTRGTIPPDMLRVLHQDGFRTETLGPADGARLADHLRRGHLAIALVDIGALHWVVLCGIRAGRVEVCDSLRDALYQEPLDEYLASRAKSMVLVEPADAPAAPAGLVAAGE